MEKTLLNIKLPVKDEPAAVQQSMLDTANSFYQAGSRCEANVKLSPNITNSLMGPSVVCYTFAVEIYLKLLLELNGVKPGKEHNLDKLYNQLPDAVREKLIAHFGAKTSDLKNLIQTVARGFVEWRYSYEHSSLYSSLEALAQLGKALHNTIRELHPAIKVTFENRLPGQGS